MEAKLCPRCKQPPVARHDYVTGVGDVVFLACRKCSWEYQADVAMCYGTFGIDEDEAALAWNLYAGKASFACNFRCDDKRTYHA